MIEPPLTLEMKPDAAPRAGRLRRVVVRIVALALVMGFVAIGWRLYRHMAAVAFFTALRGDVTWRWTGDDGREIAGTAIKLRPSYSGSFFSDADLPHLKDLYRLRVLDVSKNGSISADGLLKVLPDLRELKELDLERTPPDYPRNRSNLPNEQYLGLKLTDRDVGGLLVLNQLEILSLSGADITDVGVMELLVLKRLDSLDLSFTRITDAGVARLQELPRLKHLYLRGTGVSCEAAKALVAAWPGLDVYLPGCEEGYVPSQDEATQ